MGFEHQDPLAILLSREKNRLRSQHLKVSLQKDGLEIRFKILTAECISIAQEIQDGEDLPAKLRTIANHLEAQED